MLYSTSRKLCSINNAKKNKRKKEEHNNFLLAWAIDLHIRTIEERM